MARPDRLSLAWLFLLALSILTLVLGRGGADSSVHLDLMGAAGLLLTTTIKGREIILQYLELKRSTPAWRGVLTGYLATIATLIFLIFTASHLGWFPPHG